MGLRIPVVTALVVGISLGCGGLDFNSPAFEDASREEVVGAGYKLPDTASHVYVQDFSSIDIRSTWFQYTLSPDGFDALVAETREAGVHEEIETWSVPDEWPDYDGFAGGEAPAWWSPKGDLVFRKVVRATHGDDMGYGSQSAFDSDTHTVHLWLWEWQWWGVE